MSTEASGDGKTSTVGPAEPNAAAEESDPGNATAAEREAAGASAEGTGHGEFGGADHARESDEALESEGAIDSADPEAADEVDEPGGSLEAAESDETEPLETTEIATAKEAADTGEAGEADDVVESSEERDDDEGQEYDEALEYDGDYEDYEDYEDYDEYEQQGEYEQEEAAGPQRARRWPRALLALGFVLLAAAIVGGAIAIVGSVTHGFKKPVKVTYKKSALFSLKTGECFDPQGQSYSLIPCDSPHDAEVFATFTLGGPAWPGAAAVAKDASSGCASRLTGYLNPQLAISLSSTYVYPDSVAWKAGTRTVICEVRATSGQLTGSVRGATATAG